MNTKQDNIVDARQTRDGSMIRQDGLNPQLLIPYLPQTLNSSTLKSSTPETLSPSSNPEPPKPSNPQIHNSATPQLFKPFRGSSLGPFFGFRDYGKGQDKGRRVKTKNSRKNERKKTKEGKTQSQKPNPRVKVHLCRFKRLG